MIGWNVAALTIILVVTDIALLGSVAENMLVGGIDRKRRMGSLSSVTLDLTQRTSSWQDALDEADADERWILHPVSAFSFVDSHVENGERQLDYGIAIGYAASFMDSPVKQVSYVFKTESVPSDPDQAASTALKRGQLVMAMDAGIARMSHTRSRYSGIDRKAPVVDRGAQAYISYPVTAAS